MEIEPEPDDEFYIFSKDRRNHSGESSVENVSAYQYVNGDEARRVERNLLTQNSLPNLKNSRFAVGDSLNAKKKYSESDPLLGSNRHYGSTASAPAQGRYRRTQIFLFFYLVFFVGYLIVGSICFQRLERATEMDVRKEFREAREIFLEEHPSVSGKLHSKLSTMTIFLAGNNLLLLN